MGVYQQVFRETNFFIYNYLIFQTGELESIKQKIASLEEEKKDLQQNVEAAKKERNESEAALKTLVSDFLTLTASRAVCQVIFLSLNYMHGYSFS